MPTCIVPGCTSGYKTNPEKFHFFTIPRNLESLELWRRAVKRTDVKSGHSVCENHFSKKDILWQRQILGPDGSVLGVSPYRIPRLAKGTVPSIFPWVEEDISSKTTTRIQDHKAPAFQPKLGKPNDTFANNSGDCPLPQKRQKVDDGNKENNNTKISSLVELHQRDLECQESQEPFDCQKNKDQNQCQESVATPVSTSIEGENITSVPLTFVKLVATQINLPPGWLMQKTTCQSTRLIVLLTTRSINLENVCKTFVLKAVTVTDDLSIQVTVLDKIIRLSELNFPNQITNTTQLEKLLCTIDAMKVCKGCSSSTIEKQIKNVNCRTVSKDITETWRHHECRLLLSNTCKSCQSCRRVQKTIATKLRRWKAGMNKRKRNSAVKTLAQKKEFVRLREKLRAANTSKAKALEKCKSLQGQLKICQARLARCADLDPDALLKSGKVSENQVHVLQQIIDAAKHKNSKGRNYSEEWMLLCRHLHMRSSAAYEFLRSTEMLPLPCIRTIRRYFSKIDSPSGFNMEFFEVFKTALAQKNESERHGILLLDVMSTRESLAVDTENLTNKGLTDFGDDEQQQSLDFSQKSNQGLELMFHSLSDASAEPITVFTSSGPVKRDVLARIIDKAIILLEEIGARVHGIVSDGVARNTKFWSEVGASGARNGLRNYFDHPVVEGRKVFIFSDTPHLMKTIRNRLYNNNEKGLQMSPIDPVIKWEYIKTLRDSDKKLVGPGQDLVCPKLTLNHVSLNSTLKRQIPLAVQVFSNSVADGLRYYENKVPELKGCEATGSFCKWMNDMFDALNRTRAIDGVKVGNVDYRMIEESLRKLDAWEEHVEKKRISADLFLTKQTAEGLRATLQSSLDLIRYLTENCGFQYVLTGRINLAPLEVCLQ